MTRALRVFALQMRISAASAMAYRVNFLLEGVMSVAWTGLTLLPLLVLFGERDSVNGWDAPSALVVIGYFTALRALLEGVISPSLTDLVERIRTGAFDYVLLKPVDAQLVMSASRFQPWKIFDLLSAVAILAWAFVQRGAPPAPGHLLMGLVLFAAGAVAMYSLWVACAAAAFWVGRLDNLMYLLAAIFDTARWPVQVFPGVWRAVFTFVVPIALMTTFPAMALLGTLEPAAAAGTVAGAFAMFAVSRFLWRTAIRSYTSASS
jgi:ABC-2 type transport system permease protein